MASERMSEAEHMTLLMLLQREMTEMKRRNEEIAQKNEDEILALQKENEDVKKKLGEGGPSPPPGLLRSQRKRSTLKRWMVSPTRTSRPQ